MTYSTEKRQAAINALIDFFKENENVFNETIEELDSWNGYLNDDRYYEMYMLDELYTDTDPLEILRRAFYGYDDDTSSDDHYSEFNPNRDYFSYNGYGNLVSSDYKDYTGLLDEWFIESLIENRNHLCLCDAVMSFLDDIENA